MILTREEAIALLDQCGRFSYEEMVEFLGSIVFLSDTEAPGTTGLLKFKGLWNNPDAVAGKYDNDTYASYNSIIYRSTIANNLSVPGVDTTWVLQGGGLSVFDPTVVASGGTLPVSTTPRWLFVGAGTFNKPEGGTIVTTAALNVVATNGTSYALVLAVPVTLVDYYTKTQTDAAIAASSSTAFNSIFSETNTNYPKFGADGYVIADGRFVASAGWTVSDDAPIKEGDIISYKGTTSGNPQAIVLYTANKSSVLVLLGTNAVNTTQLFTVPAGYDYARFSSLTASTPAFSVKSLLIKSRIIDVEAALKPIGTKKTVPATILTGGYINSAGTFIISASGWNYTDDIQVSEGDIVMYKGTASASAQAIVGYNADKSVVTVMLGSNSLTQPRYFTVPAGIAIVRMSATVASAPTFAVIKYVLKKSALPDGVNESIVDLYPTYVSSHYGDSITFLCDHPDTTYGPFNGGWIKLSLDRLGIKTHFNYGISGGNISDIVTAATAGAGQTVSKVNTIFIGTNDWTQGTPLGNFTADYVGNTNNGTYAANYRKLIDYMKTANPGCIIVLITPMYRGAVAGKPESNTTVSGQLLSQFADMVINIAQYEGYGVADMFRNGPINKSNCNLRTGPNWVTYDGVHSGTYGNVGMANVIYPVMKSHIY